MTRDKLLSAIKVGIKRSGSPESIADAIELAFELESTEEAPDVPDADVPDLGIPVNPETVITAGPASALTADPNPGREVSRPSLVTLATESDMREATKPAKGPQRIRSLSALTPYSPKITLEDAIKFWSTNAPETIAIVPEGRSEEIILERSVQALPGHKSPGRSQKSDDFVKLSYKHPMVDSSFEVQYPIPVSKMMEGGIDIEAVLEDLKAKARVMYKPRPRTIEPRRPAAEALRIETAIGVGEGTPEDQDRMAAAARSGKAAVTQMFEQIRKG